jgi:hypothetical protein
MLCYNMSIALQNCNGTTPEDARALLPVKGFQVVCSMQKAAALDRTTSKERPHTLKGANYCRRK